MPVNPRKDLWPEGVSGAACNTVEGIEVDGFLFAAFIHPHADAVRPDGELHLGAMFAIVAVSPNLSHRLLRAILAFSHDGDRAAQVTHVVGGFLFVELHFLAFAVENASQPVKRAVRNKVWTGVEQSRKQGMISQSNSKTFRLAFGLILHQHKLAPFPGQHDPGREERIQHSPPTSNEECSGVFFREAQQRKLLWHSLTRD